MNELKRQLRDLRESVYTVGGVDRHDLPPQEHDISDSLLTWIEEVQDPSGRVQITRLVAQFLSEGYSRTQIDDALAILSNSGAIRLRERWVEVA